MRWRKPCRRHRICTQLIIFLRGCFKSPPHLIVQMNYKLQIKREMKNCLRKLIPLSNIDFIKFQQMSTNELTGSSKELAQYIEATNSISKPWLLVQLRLKKLQERRATLTNDVYTKELEDIYQDLMNLGEWWRGIEDEVF